MIEALLQNWLPASSLDMMLPSFNRNEICKSQQGSERLSKPCHKFRSMTSAKKKGGKKCTTRTKVRLCRCCRCASLERLQKKRSLVRWKDQMVLANLGSGIRTRHYAYAVSGGRWFRRLGVFQAIAPLPWPEEGFLGPCFNLGAGQLALH